MSGCSRLWSAGCGEYAWKLLGGQTSSLVTGSPPLVCKSIAKASKVRIPSPVTTHSGLNSAGSSQQFSAPTTSKVGAVVSALVNPQRREVQQLSTATRLTSIGLSCLRAPRSVLKQAWMTAMRAVRNEGVRGSSPLSSALARVLSYPDPWGQGPSRWWDGSNWTGRVK